MTGAQCQASTLPTEPNATAATSSVLIVHMHECLSPQGAFPGALQGHTPVRIMAIWGSLNLPQSNIRPSVSASHPMRMKGGRSRALQLSPGRLDENRLTELHVGSHSKSTPHTGTTPSSPGVIPHTRPVAKRFGVHSNARVLLASPLTLLGRQLPHATQP